MIECYGICSEKFTAMQNGKCVLDAKKAEGANDFQLLDREKVIKELTNLPTTIYNGLYQLRITHEVRNKVIAMLKEQEPIPCGEKIKAGDVVLDFYECWYCKNAIRKPWRYCPFCGKEVKWE